MAAHIHSLLALAKLQILDLVDVIAEMTVPKIQPRSALDVVVVCLVAEAQTHRGRGP